jgi:hypothetical protein
MSVRGLGAIALGVAACWMIASAGCSPVMDFVLINQTGEDLTLVVKKGPRPLPAGGRVKLGFHQLYPDFDVQSRDARWRYTSIRVPVDEGGIRFHRAVWGGLGGREAFLRIRPGGQIVVLSISNGSVAEEDVPQPVGYPLEPTD